MPPFKALSKYIEKAALAVFSLFCLCISASADIYPDTWVATDDLGRKTPTAAKSPPTAAKSTSTLRPHQN